MIDREYYNQKEEQFKQVNEQLKYQFALAIKAEIETFKQNRFIRYPLR